jgi:hypothetical protein
MQCVGKRKERTDPESAAWIRKRRRAAGRRAFVVFRQQHDARYAGVEA